MTKPTPHRHGPQSSKDLRKIRILRDASEQAIETIFGALTIHTVAPGELLTGQQDGGAAVYLVWSGALRVTLASSTGLFVTLRQLQAGSHFGEVSALGNIPQRNYRVLADEETTLLTTPASILMGILRTDEFVRMAMLEELAMTVIALADRVFEFAHLNMPMRLLAALIRMADGAEARADYVLIKPAPTHDIIAAQIGATRESITRALRGFAQDGLLQHRRGEIRIYDLAAMRALVTEAGGIIS